jgi:tRNA-specific 2-thiouridylase
MIQPTAFKKRGTKERKTPFSVGVAMSGGVDSSVTATLLKKMGHDVHGFFMALAQPDLDQQVQRVKKVAAYLDIPLVIVDLADEFKEAVIDYFTQSYFSGKTPNPCIVCNPRIKFGRLLEEILATGCQYMATGHYARVVQSQNGSFHLFKGLDPKKDQSYFLHRLTQQQLARILMPLGEQTKANVYKMAVKLGVSGVHGAESQDVCFLKGQELSNFMSRYAGADMGKGPIVTLEGAEVGRHQGIHCYTVGQRKGLGLPDATPYYVVALDPLKNAVVVGKKQDLWQKELSVGRINWIAGEKPNLPYDFIIKIRYRHKGAQLAITPGQFAVFYEDDEVMGGGEIF